ncbi:unnamed protein product [Durusdinium trenchii]|uniref:Uncharacterized protein n=1 Tax=Durusdinium trenchii TaxID=1381693 RepID=A0ABP0MIF5_9DINO
MARCVAGLANARVKGLLNNGGHVSGVKGALLAVVFVMTADVRLLNGIAGGMNVNREGGGGMLELPFCASTNRCWGTLLKNPTRSSLMADSCRSSGVVRRWSWSCCHRVGMDS